MNLHLFPALLTRRSTWIALFLVALATLRIASTYTFYSPTSDEPIHIACGLQWLSQGKFDLEEQHPPLTRVLSAVGPFLDGARSTGQTDLMVEGLIALRGEGDQHDRRLALARAGNLPLFWLACFALFLTARRVLGAAGAVASLFVFTMIPSVLAHAGQATTDMGATAFFTLAVYCLFSLLERPSALRGLLLGAALSGMVLSKFSTLAFLPASVVLSALAFWRYRPLRLPKPGPLIASLAVAFAAAFLLVWTGYRFSFGPAPYLGLNAPFPELFEGIRQVADHNASGHMSYLLGSRSLNGFWLYFPVVLGVKLPLAVLLLLAASLRFRPRETADWPLWLMWTVFGGVFLVAMNSRINIGLRHILPAIPYLSVLAAASLIAFLEKRPNSSWRPRAALAAVLLLAVPSAAAHPDYIPFFNILAGSHPEEIIVDSDLDWGQDFKRLGKRLRELNAPYVVFSPQFIADLDGLGFPPRQRFDPLHPLPGYNAVGLTPLKLNRMYLPEDPKHVKAWPESVGQYEMIGKTIRLYYFPPAR